jgi:hypothetical protein
MWKRRIFTLWQSGNKERDRKVPDKFLPPRHDPSDLFSPAQPHLLKFLGLPK